MRNKMFYVWLAVALTCSLAVSGCGKNDPGKPNVILISIDTLRADHLGCYGYEYERDTSPSIDAFAKESVLFKDAFATTCWTAPSHMSMFTSLYPSAHGVNGYPIPAKLNADIKTLTQYLKDAGYATYGQYYGHYLAPELGFDRGFDSYVQHDFISDSVDDAFDLLGDAKDDDKPFFFFLHVGDVHAPYMGINKATKKTAEFRDMYDTGYTGPIVDGSEEEILALAERFWMSQKDHTEDTDRDIYRDRHHLIALYDGAITHTDRHLGRFFKWLKDNSLYDNTLIIFTSDHGEEFGEHDNFGHNQLHRELIHVPLIMKLPRGYADTLASKGTGRVSGRVTQLDIMPTILDIEGVEMNSLRQGASLAGLIKGEAYREPVVYGESEMRSGGYQSHRSVLDGGFHAMRNIVPVRPDRQPVEHRLYDSRTDTREKFNLASKSPDKLAEYDKAIDSWQEKMAVDRSRVTRDAGPGAPAKMNEEQKNWLKSLGYVQ